MSQLNFTPLPSESEARKFLRDNPAADDATGIPESHHQVSNPCNQLETSTTGGSDTTKFTYPTTLGFDPAHLYIDQGSPVIGFDPTACTDLWQALIPSIEALSLQGTDWESYSPMVSPNQGLIPSPGMDTYDPYTPPPPYSLTLAMAPSIDTRIAATELLFTWAPVHDSPSPSTPELTFSPQSSSSQGVLSPLPAVISRGPSPTAKRTRKASTPRKPKSGRRLKNYQCNKCGRVFDRSGNLKDHMNSQTHNPNAYKPYACPHEGCGKRFIRKFDFQRHLKTLKHSNAQN